MLYWRKDGKELYYISPDSRLMQVSVKTLAGSLPSFEASQPQPLFEARFGSILAGFNTWVYAPSADGKRFLVYESLSGPSEQPLTVLVNWLAAVKK